MRKKREIGKSELESRIEDRGEKGKSVYKDPLVGVTVRLEETSCCCVVFSCAHVVLRVLRCGMVEGKASWVKRVVGNNVPVSLSGIRHHHHRLI